MKTILKKSLAMAVCVALCLTAFIGCLSVSATGTATAVISTATVTSGTTSTSLTVTISGSPNIAGARFDIVADATKATLGTPTVTTGASVEVSTPATDTTRFVVVANDVSTGLASIVVTLPYTNVTATAGTYDVEFGSLLEVAEVGETLMTVTPTDGSITVEAAHVHDFSGAWQSNANYHWKVCPADETVGEQAAHTFGGWTTTVQPGCTTTGTKTRTCSVCGYVESDTVAATGHTPAAAVQENVVAATCGAAGSYDSVVYCSVCSAEISRTTGNVIPATGEHSWNAGVVTTAPGCTTEGVLTKTCTVCGATDTEAISATGHTAGAAADEDIVAPTCTAAGSHNSVVRCTVCNAIISSTPVVDAATGHTPAAAVTENNVAATCGAAGSYDSVVYCSVCNAELSRETVNVPATGAHTWGDWVETTPATTTSTGVKTRTCSVCGAEETDTIPMIEVSEPTQLDFTMRTPVLMVQEKYGFRIRIDRSAPVTNYADYRLTLSTQYYTGANYTLTDTQTIYSPAVKDASSTSARDYYFYRNVTAYALNVPITLHIEFLDAGGNTVAVGNDLVFSVADLAKAGIPAATGSAAAQLRTMYIDLLNYGTAAQTYFAAMGNSTNPLKTATPINDGCDDYQVYASTSVPDFAAVNSANDVAGSGISCNPGLQISASNNIYYRFTLPGTVNASELRLVVTHTTLYDKNKSDTYNFSEMTVDSKGRYVLPYDGVALYDSGTTVTATVMSGETTLYELQYNVDAYISANISNSTYNALFTAMSKFTASANAYFSILAGKA